MPPPLEITARKMIETASNWNAQGTGITLSKFARSYYPKSNMILDIVKINLYTKFYFSICNFPKENEQNLRIVGFFLSPMGITLSKNT